MLSILIVHFFLRYTICCCWKNVCRFHCLYSSQDETMAPEKVLTRFDNFFYLLWCQWQSHFEWISIPRNSFFWHGFKINFLIFIIKPKFYRRYKIVSWLMWASCIVRLKINISSQYIITLMLVFLRSEIRISNNFVDTRSADLVQNTGTQTQRVPFHRILTNLLEFWPTGTLKYASFRSSLHI